MSVHPLAIGIGCNSSVSLRAVIDLIEQALTQVVGRAAGLYTMEEKKPNTVLKEAAAQLELPLIYLPLDALKAVADRAVTQSPVVYALFGVPSIAETAALVGAGPDSHLLLPRISADGVTCAIAALQDRA